MLKMTLPEAKSIVYTEKCEICQKQCGIEHKIHVKYGYGNEKEETSEGIDCYFCSKEHEYLWEIKGHEIYYRQDTRQIINHLIKAHGYEVPILEKALNEYLRKGRIKKS